VLGINLLVGRFHLRTALWRAELGDGAVEQVDLVVEVDNCSRISARLLQSFSDFLIPLTASHSSLSSPSGSLTAFLRLPLPSVASAYCFSCQLLVPLFVLDGLNGARVRGLLVTEVSFCSQIWLSSKRDSSPTLCSGLWYMPSGLTSAMLSHEPQQRRVDSMSCRYSSGYLRISSSRLSFDGPFVEDSIPFRRASHMHRYHGRRETNMVLMKPDIFTLDACYRVGRGDYSAYLCVLSAGAHSAC
jgi:hypothetical protein